MTTRVVLVALDWGRTKDPALSLGHASILARLSMEPSIEVAPLSFAVNHPGFCKEEVLTAILTAAGSREAFVAIGAFIWNEPTIQWLLPELRRAGFRGTIVLGGPQVSYAPAGVDALYPEADVFIRGYAEHALSEFVGSGGLTLPAGVSLRGADTSAQSAKPDLASLPSPLLTGVLKLHPFMRWETQRGCPYPCSFCQHREFGSRMLFRSFPEDRIRAEAELLVASKVRDIAVLDPVFNGSHCAIDTLEQLTRLDYRGRISLQCRFEQLTDTFLDACRPLDVTLEFGLQSVVREELQAVHRNNNLASIERAISMLHESGVSFEVSLIYGLPMQTLDSFRTSVNWCLDREVKVVRAFPLMLLRGTGLDRDRDRWKLVENTDIIPVVTESSTFTRAEWEQMHELASELDVASRCP